MCVYVCVPVYVHVEVKLVSTYLLLAVRMNLYYPYPPLPPPHTHTQTDHVDKLCKSLTEQLSERDRQLQVARAKLQDQVTTLHFERKLGYRISDMLASIDHSTPCIMCLQSQLPMPFSYYRRVPVPSLSRPALGSGNNWTLLGMCCLCCVPEFTMSCVQLQGV